MSPEPFSAAFARQFRQEYTLYSATEEYRHGSLLFKQVAGDFAEMGPLTALVAEKLHNAPLVHRLIAKLENEDVPQARYLCAIIDSMSNEFNAYVEREPYTAGYYKDLIAMLDSFQKIADAFEKDVCEELANKLKDLYTAIHDEHLNAAIDDNYANTVIEQIDFYLKNMLAYYNHFMVIWQNEADNSQKGLRLTTQVADHLSELIAVTELVIASMENTRELLLTWDAHVQMSEVQALFN